jgi:hypothetical protein
VKSFTKLLATLGLVFVALASSQAQAGEAVAQPAGQTVIQLAWDRVGSPVNPFG